MKDQIEKIRGLLDELESSKPSEEPSFKESFQLFELPEIVGSIVDYLQPTLEPYEAAIYWYLFRHSIVATGDVFVRVSVRGLQEGVVSSMRSGREGSPLSYKSVQDSLTGLCNKGAASIAGDVNRDGTLWRGMGLTPLSHARGELKFQSTSSARKRRGASLPAALHDAPRGTSATNNAPRLGVLQPLELCCAIAMPENSKPRNTLNTRT